MSALIDPAISAESPESQSSYDQWFERKVLAAQQGLRDGSNRCFSAEEWAAIRAAKKAQLEAL